MRQVEVTHRAAGEVWPPGCPPPTWEIKSNTDHLGRDVSVVASVRGGVSSAGGQLLELQIT